MSGDRQLITLHDNGTITSILKFSFILFSVAIELIVQHIRDFLNNRCKGDTDTNTSFFLDTTKGKPNCIESASMHRLH